MPQLLQEGLSVLLATLLLSPPLSAAPVIPVMPAIERGDAALGRTKADDERCMECHGSEGQGAENGNGTEGKFPRLAGQQPSYLFKQLRDFRSGARKHDIMTMMARSVEEADLRDIVAYFAAQTHRSGDGTQAQGGRQLYLEGDAARHIPACASCHGADGRGSANAPVLAGQTWLYLERQLLDWRSRWRTNSPGGVMNQVTQDLNDREIQALASHLSGLP